MQDRVDLHSKKTHRATKASSDVILFEILQFSVKLFTRYILRQKARLTPPRKLPAYFLMQQLGGECVLGFSWLLLPPCW